MSRLEATGAVNRGRYQDLALIPPTADDSSRHRDLTENMTAKNTERRTPTPAALFVVGRCASEEDRVDSRLLDAGGAQPMSRRRFERPLFCRREKV